MFCALALVALTADPAVCLPFPLRDATGVEHTQSELHEAPLTVFVFLAVDCPICNTSIPSLNALAARFPKAHFLGVNTASDNTAEQVLAHDREFKLAFPTLLDPDLKLARAVKAETNPTAVVVDAKGAVLYRGRIDDRAVDFGKVRSKPRREDLSLAIEEALAGKAVSVPSTPSVGCAITGAVR
jgi:peroxiredoxin